MDIIQVEKVELYYFDISSEETREYYVKYDWFENSTLYRGDGFYKCVFLVDGRRLWYRETEKGTWLKLSLKEEIAKIEYITIS